MAEQTLFLAWHGAKENRLWFPVGRLDADSQASNYRFRYTRGAKRAQKEARFPLLMEFPDLNRTYQSEEIFPIFQNRVMSPARPDFKSYLETLDLSGKPDPVEILAVNGGQRVTDNYEVFPRLVKQPDGGFVCRFLLHGQRYVSQLGQERLSRLAPGEELLIALELTNPATQLAVQIQTRDHHILGWAPHYLVNDLAISMAEAPGKYEAKVVRVHPQRHTPLPSLLIELRSYWTAHEPMTGEDYQPLVD